MPTGEHAGAHADRGIVWERRDARLIDHRDGSVAFEQVDVEVPLGWSQNATNILAQKYFRGALGTPERETSLRQVVGRIVGSITEWGKRDGYFADEAEAEAFSAELSHLLFTQRAAFNSPVWFNIGVKGVPQQASACFILSVDDTLESILNWYTEEGIIFKGGSGSGANLSRLRASCEPLEGGGHRVRAGQFHARSGRFCWHRQIRRQDPQSREDGAASTRTIPTSRISSGAKPVRSAKRGYWQPLVSTWAWTGMTSSPSNTRTPTTPYGSPTSSCKPL